MRAKTLLIGAAVAAGVFLLLKRRAGGDSLGWWQALPGMRPGTEQAALLAQQDAVFYSTAMGYSTSPY